MDWLPTATRRPTGRLERSLAVSSADGDVGVIRGTVLCGMPINGSPCAKSWPAAKLCGTYWLWSVDTIQVSGSGPLPGSNITPDRVNTQAPATTPAVLRSRTPTTRSFGVVVLQFPDFRQFHVEAEIATPMRLLVVMPWA
jgi:hypothetical protein